MRLTDSERRTISAIHLSADSSVETIAKQTGLRPSSVRYAISKLSARGLIKQRVYIDTYKFGIKFFGFCFGFRTSEKGARNRFEEFLIAHPRVSYLALAGPPREYSIDLIGRDVNEVYSVFSEICAKFPGNVTDVEMWPIRKLVDLPLRFLEVGDKELTPTRTLSLGECAETIKIDPVDDQILEAWANNPEAKPAALARKLGLPYTTLHHRIQCLKESGVIAGNTYLIDLFSLNISYFSTQVVLKDHSVQAKEKVNAFIRNHRDVFAFLEVSGPFDYIVETASLETRNGSNFALHLLDQLSEIVGTVSTVPVLRWLKISHYPCLLAQL